MASGARSKAKKWQESLEGHEGTANFHVEQCRSDSRGEEDEEGIERVRKTQEGAPERWFEPQKQ